MSKFFVPKATIRPSAVRSKQPQQTAVVANNKAVHASSRQPVASGRQTLANTARRQMRTVAAGPNWTPELEARRDELRNSILSLQAEGAAAHRSMTETAVAFKKLQTKLAGYRAKGRPVDTFQAEAQELRELRENQLADAEAISNLHMQINNYLHELQMVQRRAGAKVTAVPRDGIKSFDTLRLVLENERKSHRERSLIPDQSSYYGDFEDGDERSEAVRKLKEIQRRMAAVTQRMSTDPANSGKLIEELAALNIQLEAAKKAVPPSIKNSVYLDIEKIGEEIKRLTKTKNERNEFFIQPTLDALVARLEELKKEDAPIRLRRQYDMLNKQLADLKKQKQKARFGESYLLDVQIQALEQTLENIAKDPSLQQDPDRVRRAKAGAVRQQIAKLRASGKKDDIVITTQISRLEVLLKELDNDLGTPPPSAGGPAAAGPGAGASPDPAPAPSVSPGGSRNNRGARFRNPAGG